MTKTLIHPEIDLRPRLRPGWPISGHWPPHNDFHHIMFRFQLSSIHDSLTLS